MMTLTPTLLKDVALLDPRVISDARGFFTEVWNILTFSALGIDAQFVQDNHSRSTGGVLRGLHYQLRRPQGKLVRVIAGEIFDVTVDMRRKSPTFGQWAGEWLSAENMRMLWIPPGIAHGFYVTSAYAEFVYKCTDFYAPDDERTLQWDDPDIAVRWPLLPGRPLIMSEKDRRGTPFKTIDVFETDGKIAG